MRSWKRIFFGWRRSQSFWDGSGFSTFWQKTPTFIKTVLTCHLSCESTVFFTYFYLQYILSYCREKARNKGIFAHSEFKIFIISLRGSLVCVTWHHLFIYKKIMTNILCKNVFLRFKNPTWLLGSAFYPSGHPV